jgi:hypothetical protein
MQLVHMETETLILYGDTSFHNPCPQQSVYCLFSHWFNAILMTLYTDSLKGGPELIIINNMIIYQRKCKLAKYIPW